MKITGSVIFNRCGKELLIILLILAFAPPTVDAAKEKEKLTAAEAIDVLENGVPGGLRGTNLPAFGGVWSATWYKLYAVMYAGGYDFKPADTTIWRDYMLCETNHIYGRFCAAGYLLAESEQARSLIAENLASDNLRRRYNAVTILTDFGESAEPWSVNIMVDLILTDALDGTDAGPMGFSYGLFGEDPLAEKFPDGDGVDISLTPVDDICRKLGRMKATNAVPALIAVLERQPDNEDAITALGEIGDPRGFSVLLNLFERGDHSDRMIWALSEVGGQRAVEPLREYLKNKKPGPNDLLLQRLLIQLTAEDPLRELIALYDTLPVGFGRDDVLVDLSGYKDIRAVEKLDEVARSSGCAREREWAIYSLGAIGNDDAVEALRKLKKIRYPDDLDRGRLWKQQINDFTKYFRRLIREQLLEIRERSGDLDHSA